MLTAGTETSADIANGLIMMPVKGDMVWHQSAKHKMTVRLVLHCKICIS